MSSPEVLVVEDDALIQTTLCATLTLLGFRAHRAESIDDALKVLGTEHVDALVLDIRLPDLKGLQRSGLTLLAFLRSTPEHAHVPVLVFTGMPLSPEDEAMVHQHNAEVFYKPQRYAVLIDHLNRLLDRQPAA